MQMFSLTRKSTVGRLGALTFTNVRKTNSTLHAQNGEILFLTLVKHKSHQSLLEKSGPVTQSCIRKLHKTNPCRLVKNRAGIYRALYEEGLNLEKIMAEAGDSKPYWLTIDKFKVFPWALSGLESSIVVEGRDFKVPILFDIGYSHRASVKCQNVFISHGHLDHTTGIVSHWAKRSLYGAKSATYYVPPNLVSKLKQAVNLFYSLNENSEEVLECPIIIQPAVPGANIDLPGKLVVVPFPTVHRVPSQGYIVYKHSSRLKEEYVGRDGKEISELVKSGVEIHDKFVVPEIAYTGDTTFEVFQSVPNPDLLKVKLLITESTYIDDEIDKLGDDAQTRARKRGHMHIQEILDNAHLFENVQNILLVHFSDKYSTGYIKKRLEKLIPENLKKKIHIGLTMKEINI